MTSVTAVVATAPKEGKVQWSHEEIQPPTRSLKENELLVRMIATGICHTDIFCSSLPHGVFGMEYPKIFGHEGAGEVEAIGSGVKVAKPGDKVLLSYTYCATCDLCKEGKESYCESFHINSTGEAGLFKSKDGEACGGGFFGQSSFASLSIVDEKSVVNVEGLIQTPEELKRCAPFGCGLMTGSGAILNNAKPHDIVIVTGIGAVGAGAIMTARIVGCKAIIAVDRLSSRLAVAKDLGATHTYDTSTGGDFVTDIQALVDNQRIAYAIETTGVPSIMESALRALGKRGKLVQIGVPSLEASLTLPLGDFFFQTKVVEVNYLGDARARELVPKMIQWYKEGKFPVDKIIKFYPARDVQIALEEMKGDVIKPVLKF